MTRRKVPEYQTRSGRFVVTHEGRQQKPYRLTDLETGRFTDSRHLSAASFAAEALENRHAIAGAFGSRA